MRHGYNKIKFRGGKDANDMLMRKLAVNFITHGHIVTTETKAKALRSFVDRIVTKAKGKTEADKNYLLQYFPQAKYRAMLVGDIATVMAERTSGFTRTIRMNQRDSDGAMMVKLEWSQPIVLAVEEPKAESAEAKEPAKTEKVTKKTK